MRQRTLPELTIGRRWADCEVLLSSQEGKSRLVKTVIQDCALLCGRYELLLDAVLCGCYDWPLDESSHIGDFVA